MREVERLGIAKLQWSRKIDREIIAQLILREGCAVTIGDLAARSGDIENVSARQFLCLERGNDFLIKRGRRWDLQKRMQVPAAVPLRWRTRRAAVPA